MPVHPHIPEHIPEHMPGQVPEPVAPDRLELGEGARVLADGSVVIVDILSGRLLQVPHAGGPLVELARIDEPLGAAAPLTGRPGRWLAAAGTGFATFTAGSPDGGGGRPGTRPEWIARPAEGKGPRRRMNDAVCDPSGRMWAGSMAYDATEGAGSLYRLDRDGTVTEVVDGLTVPNGPAFDATGTRMFLADTARGIIDVFDIDPATGALGGRRPFTRVPAEDGQPDGMAVELLPTVVVTGPGPGRSRRQAAGVPVAGAGAVSAAGSPCGCWGLRGHEGTSTSGSRRRRTWRRRSGRRPCGPRSGRPRRT